jgi:ParB family chromosome partitioning protein
MRKALGRGLNALFPDSPIEHTPVATHGTSASAVLATAPGRDNGTRLLAIADIRPNPGQPRHSIRAEELQGLVESIRQHGMIQPLLVRLVENGFELIAGERRWRAAGLAGLERVPAVVREASDGESFELAIIENVQRSDLTPLEEAEAFARLTDEFGMTQEEVARRVGKSRATVANTIRLLGLPTEVKEHVASGALTMGHARALLAAPSAARQMALTKLVVTQGLTVRALERLATSSTSHRPTSFEHPTPDVHVKAVEDELCGLLGTRVHLVRRGRGGSIDIRYHSPDELERLLAFLRGRDLFESNAL